jgi:hypothetical protein
MTMYLSNADVRPTGYEAGESIEGEVVPVVAEPSFAPGERRGCRGNAGPMSSVWHVDPTVAREVAAAYVDATDRQDAVTVAAFAQLVAETDRLFAWITQSGRPKALRVFFTECEAPYRDAQELIGAVRASRVLEITTVAADRQRRHTLMGNELGGSYDRFRAVHDALGHIGPRLGFDRDGEFTAWRTQERFHSPLARRALATELHGQHSVRWTTGEIATPKAILLEDSLLKRARRRGDS